MYVLPEAEDFWGVAGVGDITTVGVLVGVGDDVPMVGLKFWSSFTATGNKPPAGFILTTIGK